MGAACGVQKELCDECVKSGNKSVATLYCLNCSRKFCDSCNNKHQQALRHQHKVVALGEFKQGRHDDYLAKLQRHGCKKHVTYFLEYFCTQHGTYTCEICNSEEHMSCDVKSAEALQAAWDKEIRRNLRRLEFTAKTLEQKHTQLSGFQEQLPLVRHKLHDDLEERIEQLKEQLNNIKNRLDNDIDLHLDEKQNRLNDLSSLTASKSGEAKSAYAINMKTYAETKRSTEPLVLMQGMRSTVEQEVKNTTVDTTEIGKALETVVFKSPDLSQDDLEEVVGEVRVEQPTAAEVAIMRMPEPPSTAGSWRSSFS